MKQIPRHRYYITNLLLHLVPLIGFAALTAKFIQAFDNSLGFWLSMVGLVFMLLFLGFAVYSLLTDDYYCLEYDDHTIYAYAPFKTHTVRKDCEIYVTEYRTRRGTLYRISNSPSPKHSEEVIRSLGKSDWARMTAGCRVIYTKRTPG